MWTAILLACVGCYLLKLAGLSLPERVLNHPTVERVADLIPVALLAALVAVQVFCCCGCRSWSWSWGRRSWRHSRASSDAPTPRVRQPTETALQAAATVFCCTEPAP